MQSPDEFVSLTWDPVDGCYLRSDDGAEVMLDRTVHVLFETEYGEYPLAFTRKRDGLLTRRPVPVLRIDGEKVFLDDERVEVSTDDMIEVCPPGQRNRKRSGSR